MAKKQPETPPEDPKTPSPASLLAQARWAKESPKERTARAKKAVRKRWQGKGGKAAMREYLSRIASGPRKRRDGTRLADRCPCGKYTRWRAEKRGHRCTPPPDQPPS